MNTVQQSHGVVDAILRAVRRQKPQAKTGQTRRKEDIPPDLLEQIKTEATRTERKRLLASDRSRNLLVAAFQALKPQLSRR
jgi:hypothetical protein